MKFGLGCNSTSTTGIKIITAVEIFFFRKCDQDELMVPALDLVSRRAQDMVINFSQLFLSS